MKEFNVNFILKCMNCDHLGMDKMPYSIQGNPTKLYFKCPVCNSNEEIYIERKTSK